MSFEQVKEVMVETLNCEEEDIKPEALLEDDLGIDSLDAVELALALEELFGVKIPDE
jgi:acyl carrier protein